MEEGIFDLGDSEAEISRASSGRPQPRAIGPPPMAPFSISLSLPPFTRPREDTDLHVPDAYDRLGPGKGQRLP